MNQPRDHSQVVRGAYIAAEACYPIWKVLQRHITAAQARDGGRVAPPVQEALATLRQVAAEHIATTSVNGPAERTFTDKAIPSIAEVETVTTAAFAGLLGVSERHVRRLAGGHNVAPIARGLWSRKDAHYVLAVRRGTTTRRNP